MSNQLTPAQTQQMTTIDAAGALATIDQRPLSQNPAAVYLASLRPGSRPAMQRALNTIAGVLGMSDPNEGLPPRHAARVDDDRYLFVPWQELRYQHTAAIRAALAEEFSYSTVNKTLSALRGVLAAAWRLGQMGAEEYHRAIDLKGVKGATVPAGRAITAGEIAALLDSCGQDATGIRDAALISVAYACGLRRAEIVALQLGDYDPAAGTLLVKGKGNKERSLPVANGAAAALGDWIAIRGDDPGPLFMGTGNRQRGGRLTTQAIYNMLQARAEAAGVQGLSPHDFRRTFIGDLLDKGADISTVAKLAGHASVTTTARYDRRDDKAKRAAVDLLHVPYTRRVLVNGGAE